MIFSLVVQGRRLGGGVPAAFVFLAAAGFPVAAFEAAGVVAPVTVFDCFGPLLALEAGACAVLTVGAGAVAGFTGVITGGIAVFAAGAPVAGTFFHFIPVLLPLTATGAFAGCPAVVPVFAAVGGATEGFFGGRGACPVLFGAAKLLTTFVTFVLVVVVFFIL